jgi:hypothetical protein
MSDHKKVRKSGKLPIVGEILWIFTQKKPFKTLEKPSLWRVGGDRAFVNKFLIQKVRK